MWVLGLLIIGCGSKEIASSPAPLSKETVVTNVANNPDTPQLVQFLEQQGCTLDPTQGHGGAELGRSGFYLYMADAECGAGGSATLYGIVDAAGNVQHITARHSDLGQRLADGSFASRFASVKEGVLTTDNNVHSVNHPFMQLIGLGLQAIFYEANPDKLSIHSTKTPVDEDEVASVTAALTEAGAAACGSLIRGLKVQHNDGIARFSQDADMTGKSCCECQAAAETCREGRLEVTTEYALLVKEAFDEQKMSLKVALTVIESTKDDAADEQNLLQWLMSKIPGGPAQEQVLADLQAVIQLDGVRGIDSNHMAEAGYKWVVGLISKYGVDEVADAIADGRLTQIVTGSGLYVSEDRDQEQMERACRRIPSFSEDDCSRALETSQRYSGFFWQNVVLSLDKTINGVVDNVRLAGPAGNQQTCYGVGAKCEYPKCSFQPTGSATGKRACCKTTLEGCKNPDPQDPGFCPGLKLWALDETDNGCACPGEGNTCVQDALCQFSCAQKTFEATVSPTLTCNAAAGIY